MTDSITKVPQNNTDLFGLVRQTKVGVTIETLGHSTNSADTYTLFDDSETYEVCTANIPNAYYIFTFQNHFIIPTNYTITVNEEWNDELNFPVRWKVEGSYQSKGEWYEIGTVDDSNLKNEKMKTFSLDVPNSMLNIFKRLKFTMSGKSSNEWQYYFCMHKMDFFGTLIDNRNFSAFLRKILDYHPQNEQYLNFAALISVFMCF